MLKFVQVNGQRTQAEPEFELFHALPDIFLANRYFDVFIEYAKADVEDILCRITTINRGPDPAPMHVLPRQGPQWLSSWERGYTVSTFSDVAIPQMRGKTCIGADQGRD